jgi:hypothetical protein
MRPVIPASSPSSATSSRSERGPVTPAQRAPLLLHRRVAARGARAQPPPAAAAASTPPGARKLLESKG